MGLGNEYMKGGVDAHEDLVLSDRWMNKFWVEVKSAGKNESIDDGFTGDISNMRSGDSGRLIGENVEERIVRSRVGICMGVDGLYGISWRVSRTPECGGVGSPIVVLSATQSQDRSKTSCFLHTYFGFWNWMRSAF